MQQARAASQCRNYHRDSIVHCSFSDPIFVTGTTFDLSCFLSCCFWSVHFLHRSKEKVMYCQASQTVYIPHTPALVSVVECNVCVSFLEAQLTYASQEQHQRQAYLEQLYVCIAELYVGLFSKIVYRLIQQNCIQAYLAVLYVGPLSRIICRLIQQNNLQVY